MRTTYIGNRGGIPVFSSITPVVGTADVRFVLPNNAFRWLGAKGKIVLELASAIPSTATTTLPVNVEVNGQVLQLTNATGAGYTAGELASVVYLEVLFDKVANALVVTSNIA